MTNTTLSKQTAFVDLDLKKGTLVPDDLRGINVILEYKLPSGTSYTSPVRLIGYDALCLDSSSSRPHRNCPRLIFYSEIEGETQAIAVDDISGVIGAYGLVEAIDVFLERFGIKKYKNNNTSINNEIGNQKVSQHGNFYKFSVKLALFSGYAFSFIMISVILSFIIKNISGNN